MQLMIGQHDIVHGAFMRAYCDVYLYFDGAICTNSHSILTKLFAYLHWLFGSRSFSIWLSKKNPIEMPILMTLENSKKKKKIGCFSNDHSIMFNHFNVYHQNMSITNSLKRNNFDKQFIFHSISMSIAMMMMLFQNTYQMKQTIRYCVLSWNEKEFEYPIIYHFIVT